MEGIVALLILLVVIALLSGPVALILSIIAMNRLKEIERRPEPAGDREALPAKAEKPSPVASEQTEAPPAATTEAEPLVQPRVATLLQDLRQVQADMSSTRMLTLEQRIGTQWVLIAGVVTVIFAAGYFLKYAYDNRWITPLGQVVVAAIAGLASLAIGELTRRRGYGVVAKGVTAMGFAILYATVFAANRWYHLVGSVPAYVLASIITLGAMLYAVGFDEIVAALLALVGGYFTPVVVSTGEDLPIPLFAYVLILSSGAMLCAYWRRWAAVNALAWVGTYFLYTSWFERFYRPTMEGPKPPEQLGIALFWLTVFFVVFLVLPILHALRRRIKSQLQDVALIAVNATVVLYYLWTILGHDYRTSLALCSLALGGAHLAMAAIAAVRCKEDVNLRQVLLVIGLAGVTLAVPLYWRRYTIPAVLAVEAAVLAVAGVRYRSLLVQSAAAAVIGVAICWLTYLWPMHDEPFRAVFNPAFGTWCLVSAAILACHLLYRFNREADVDVGGGLAVHQVFYAGGMLLLMVAVSAELWFDAHLNHKPLVEDNFFVRRMILVFPAFVLLFAVRPVCPRGLACQVIAFVLAAAGAAYLIANYLHLRSQSLIIFANMGFATAMAQVAVLFASAYLVWRSESTEGVKTQIPVAFELVGIVVLWILLTQEVWTYFRSNPRAQMWISVMWAGYGTILMIVGFWRNVRVLRYVALSLFLLLLGKIFLCDTRTLQMAYRIVGFLATGLVLVAISYLYQYLKKKGFFDNIVAGADKRR